MHEMAITQGIIDLCIEHAGSRKILGVDIEIGELSSVVPEAIEFCFDACSRDTLLEGAALKIFRIPGIGRCQDCNQESVLKELYDCCSLCGSNRITVISGEELRVREIEVDDP